MKKARKSKEQTVTVKECMDMATANYIKMRDKVIAKSLKMLEGKDGSEYEEAYNKVFPEMVKKLTKYEFIYRNMMEAVHPFTEVKDFFEKFREHHDYAPEDAYFRKVNCIYRYFQERLVDEACMVTKSDMEDLIQRCDKILEGVDLRTDDYHRHILEAEHLLPTQSGFFFGSTEYDKWYFADVKDIRRQMKRLLRGFNDETDVCCVVMSW